MININSFFTWRRTRRRRRVCLSSLLKLRSRKTVRFPEQVMSADEYSSLLNSGSLDNAIREFSLAKPS